MDSDSFDSPSPPPSEPPPEAAGSDDVCPAPDRGIDPASALVGGMVGYMLGSGNAPTTPSAEASPSASAAVPARGARRVVSGAAVVKPINVDPRIPENTLVSERLRRIEAVDTAHAGRNKVPQAGSGENPSDFNEATAALADTSTTLLRPSKAIKPRGTREPAAGIGQPGAVESKKSSGGLTRRTAVAALLTLASGPVNGEGDKTTQSAQSPSR